MNSRQLDTTLVIKARDEASRAIDAIETAFQGLLGVQQQVAAGSKSTATGIQSVVATLAGLDRAYSQIAGAAKQGSEAMDRQAASIAANKAQLAALEAQSQGAARAIDQLSVKLVDALLNKADAGPLRAQIAEVRAEMGRLDAEAGKLSRTIGQQEGNFDRSASTLRDVEAATRLAAAVSTFAASEAEDYARALDQQAAKGERAAQVLRDIARVTDARGGKSAADSASVFRSAGLTSYEREAARHAEENAAAVSRLKGQLDPAAASQAKLNRELEKAKRWYEAGELSAEEFAAAQVLIRKTADDAAKAMGRQTAVGRFAALGLQPHELQNLGYQLNDVVTQLASGTSLTQTLAQQGGQLIQIFPRVGQSLGAALSNPAALALVGTLGAMVVALKEVGDEAERVRSFTALLATNVDGVAFDPRELNEAAEALDKYGLSAEEAVTAVRLFVKEGVDQTALVEFGKTAANLALVMSIDLKDAAKEVTDAFTGGYEAVKKLDDAYNFLSAAQREQIRTLFEQGDAIRAQTTAHRIFADLQEKAADDMRGPWASAMRELSAAWKEFTTFLSDLAPIRAAAAALESFGVLIRRTIQAMRGGADAADLMQQIAEKEAAIAKLRGQNSNIAKLQLDDAERGLATLRRQLAEVQARTDAEAEGNRVAGKRNELLNQSIEGAAKLRQEYRGQSEQTKKQSQDLDELAKKEAKRKSVEAEVAEARRAATEFVEKEFRFADQATKNAYIAQKATEARQAAQKRLADEAKREADEVRRAAEERRKGYIQDIQDNGRQDVVATARRYEGMNERRNRGDLQQFFRDNGINVDPEMTAWCAAFVNAVLKANGVKGTGKLNARSFLDFGQDSTSNPQEGDIVVLRRGRGGAQGHVGFFQGFDQKGNVRVLGGNQRDGVNTQSFKRDDVLGFRRIPNAAQVAKEQFDEQEKLRESQQRFNDNLAAQLATRKQDTAQLEQQNTLDGNALQLAQRKAAIEDAVLKKTQEAKKAGVDTESDEFKKQIAVLTQVEGAYFDAANAKRAYQNTVDDVMQPVNELTALRDAIQQQIEAARQAGNGALVGTLTEQLDTVNLKLSESIQKALDFYKALASNPAAMAALGLTAEQIERIRLGLESADLSTKKFNDRVVITNDTIARTFSNSAVSAVDRFAQAVANGEDVFRSLKDMFLSFAADFLRQIAQMILQQLIFNAVSRALGSLMPGGISIGGGGANGFMPDPRHGIGGILFHKGGVVGVDGENRAALPDWFHNATRYHTGGVAGLRPDELPAILQRGEEVLTADDPRHRANGGLPGAGPVVNLKNVNVFDSADVLERALSSRTGERVLLNFVRNNRGGFRSALGNG